MTSILHKAWTWLLSLDPTTRAAVIGSFATMVSVAGALLGVYLNLAWNRKQHQDEKSYNLRRDVYLQTLDAINRAFVCMLERDLLSDAPQAQRLDPAAAEFWASCARVHLLGGKRVVEAIVAVETAYRRWSRKPLFRKLAALGSVLEKTEQLDAGIQSLETERNDIENQIKSFNFGNDDATERERVSALLKGWEAKKGKLKLNAESVAAIFEVATGVTKDATEADKIRNLTDGLQSVAGIQEEVDPLLDKLTVAMKNDLGLHGDERWYLERMEQFSRESKKSIRKLIETVSSLQRGLTRIKQLEVAHLPAKPAFEENQKHSSVSQQK